MFVEMKLIITGGGTGGHVYPALAVARELLGRRPDHEVLFVGAKRGLETKLAPRAGYRIETLNVTGLKGRGAAARARSLFLLAGALFRSLGIIRRHRPDVVLGVGGYASGPMGLATALSGRPLAIAEQNSVPGMTNRWLGKFAKKVFVSFPGSEKAFPEGKAAVTGNPALPEFFDAQEKKVGDTLNVLVIGGSQGAVSINNAMAQAAPLLDKVAEKINIVHQTGERDLEMMRTIYKNSRFGWEAGAFFHDMPKRMAEADLVISRAGAGAIFEICASGRASALVPFPHAADDHQTKNAQALEQRGAAIVIDDAALDGKAVAGLVGRFLDAPGRLEEMGRKARRMAKPDAAAKIVDGLLELAGEAS